MLAPRSQPFLLLLLAIALPAVANVTPYEAVLIADAPAWTTPTNDRVVAATLPADTRVTVYEQRAGFAAIQPPTDSTSLVAADALQLGVAGATVVAAVTSWACDAEGARASKSVTLLPGERVQVIERVEESDGSVWWRIEPPSGEFRWVRESDLRLSDTSATIEERPTASPIPLSPIPVSTTEAPAGEIEPTDHVEAPSIGDQAPGNEIGGDADFSTRLAAIELALSTIVSTPANAWRLGPVRREAESLRRDAASDTERRDVADVLARIERFAAIADRTAANYRVAPPVSRTKTTPRIAPNDEARRLGYDAVGRLRPVVSSNEDAPRFAVVGRDGELLTLVTPGADVDLQRHLGKRVGLSGAKGFIPRYGKPHLTAQRVQVLR